MVDYSFTHISLCRQCTVLTFNVGRGYFIGPSQIASSKKIVILPGPVGNVKNSDTQTEHRFVYFTISCYNNLNLFHHKLLKHKGKRKERRSGKDGERRETRVGKRGIVERGRWQREGE